MKKKTHEIYRIIYRIKIKLYTKFYTCLTHENHIEASVKPIRNLHFLSTLISRFLSVMRFFYISSLMIRFRKFKVKEERLLYDFFHALNHRYSVYTYITCICMSVCCSFNAYNFANHLRIFKYIYINVLYFGSVSEGWKRNFHRECLKHILPHPYIDIRKIFHSLHYYYNFIAKLNIVTSEKYNLQCAYSTVT